MPNTFTKDKLKVKILPTRDEMGRVAADEAAEAIRELTRTREDIVVVFAAAPSQSEFLAHLAAKKDVDFSRITAFHMDEYAGLPESSPQRFATFMDEHFFKKVTLKRVLYMHSFAEDARAECRRVAELLDRYPPDLVFMGIGENAHIAFNDPGVAKFDDPEIIKLVELTHASRVQQVNDGCFPSLDQVPTHAMTMTVPTLMRASRHFCMVPAKSKAQAVRDTLQGQIDEMCPATILRRAPNATLYLDADSASLLGK